MTDWERAAPWIEAALAESLGGWSLDEVKAQIEAGAQKLWVGAGAAMVTQISDYPKGRVLEIVFAGGDGDELVDLMLPKIEDEARERSCVEIQVVGRQGWLRRLKPCGYAPLYVVLRKEFP